MSTTTDGTTVTQGRAPVPGGELGYDVRGAGRPVVLLHSGGADRRLWDAEADALSGDHLVVRYDARAHGRSTSPTADWEFHEDLRALLAHLGIERPTLVGLSLGAATALDYAITYPDDVAAALVVSPGFLGALEPVDPHAVAAAVAQQAAVEAWDAAAWVEAGLRAWVIGPRRSVDDVRPGVVERCRAWSLETVTTHAAASMGHAFHGVGAKDRLSAIRCPVETVVGALDTVDCVLAAGRVDGAVPGSRLHVVPTAAHMVNLDEPEVFAGILGGFLDRTAQS
ncbi:MAG: alpha/beta fold hydrolase [Actinobacteria bacterium]|nr:alpha/beta fold hydrolase [Actinomycetota bacterium]